MWMACHSCSGRCDHGAPTVRLHADLPRGARQHCWQSRSVGCIGGPVETQAMWLCQCMAAAWSEVIKGAEDSIVLIRPRYHDTTTVAISLAMNMRGRRKHRRLQNVIDVSLQTRASVIANTLSLPRVHPLLGPLKRAQNVLSWFVVCKW